MNEPCPSPQQTSFCHTFDLTKRLTLTPSPPIAYIPIPASNDEAPTLYSHILTKVSSTITSSPPNQLHRLIMPSLLSPALYPPHAATPTQLLPFLHSLRALLRRHNHQLTAMITLPLSLYPRSTGLVRWIEHLTDGVIELAPFPHSIDIEPPLTSTGKSGKTRAEEKPQGMVKIHRLPVLTEKGGGSGAGDDLAFSLGRKRFVVVPFHLPPVEGDGDAQRGEAEGGSGGGKGIEF